MRCALRWAGLALVLPLVLPAFAEDKPPKDAKPAKEKADDKAVPKEKKEAEAKLIAAGEITGKLTQVSEKSITVQVTLKYTVPNLDALRNIANVQQSIRHTQLDRNLNPTDRARRLADLQRQLFEHQRNAQQVKEENKSFELKLADDVKVRTLVLPPAFDDKGRLRQRTRKELDELKGDDKKLPGYTADRESLRPEQIVTASLTRKKAAAPPKGVQVPDGLDDNKPTVSMILIRAEPQPRPGN